ncbi:hypothetical protein Tco_0241965 [Tanacetum coccineum]
MIRMLQGIDREDLEALWRIVKEKYSDIRPEDKFERVLWGYFKVMFKPDKRSDVWRILQGYKVTIWKLIDSSGVYFIRFENVHIFMLVEKRYPLTPITITNMLNKKLQTDHQNGSLSAAKAYVKQQKGLEQQCNLSFALRNFDLEDMELESTNSGPTAKLPILKLGEYEMWVIRIKQYFQIQDYSLWEVIENGDSWVSVPQTVLENGTSVTKMSIPVTAEEKTNKKNDVKARSLLLMALPNEHQLTFNQYPDAKLMFAAIETSFIRSQYACYFSVVIAQEDLNLNFLSSLPPEWNTHVVVWLNKPEIETISIDDLYNNFKIVEKKVNKSVGASSGAQNLAFMTASSTSSTNDTNTASLEVSTASPNVNAASPQVSTASVSDNTMYAFMVENPNGSNVLHLDLEQIYKDDLEAIDLKWQLSPASESRAPRSKEVISEIKTTQEAREQRRHNLQRQFAIDGGSF